MGLLDGRWRPESPSHGYKLGIFSHPSPALEEERGKGLEMELIIDRVSIKIHTISVGWSSESFQLVNSSTPGGEHTPAAWGQKLPCRGPSQTSPDVSPHLVVHV